jgi:hypothetical protein
LAIVVIVLWGYFTVCLPSNLLQSTDHHALNLIKKLMRLGGQSGRTKDGVAIQSQKQQRQSQALVAFIKVLSDQQLITGLSILIAALASRCHISLYEWNVVTSLGYFSATTHSLSLDVLQDYLYKHTWFRYCRMLFTLVFLVLFSFVFVLDHLVYRYSGVVYSSPFNSGMIVQCLFIGNTASEYLNESDFIFAVPVLVLLWGKHISAISRMHVASASQETHGRHISAKVLDYISLHSFSWTGGLPRSDCKKIFEDARARYDAKIGSSQKKKKGISMWYFLEQYHESYLSEIPIWAFQFFLRHYEYYRSSVE